MDIFQAIKERRSIRKYREDKVEEEKLEKILETARLAPSAKNLQPWKIIMVEDPRLREGLVKATKGQEFMATAPLSAVICVNDAECYQNHGDYMSSFAVDGSILMDHLTLAARAEGLGTCWIGKFNEAEVKSLLDIPADWRVVTLTPLGYPAEKGKFRGRKPLSEILYLDRWGREKYEF